MRLRIRIKHKKQQRQPSQYPQPRLDLAHSPGTTLQNGSRTNPAVIPIPTLYVKLINATTANAGMSSVKSSKRILVRHQQAHDDQRWTVSLRRNRRNKWREKPSARKTNGRYYCGPSSSPACFDSGRRLDQSPIGTGQPREIPLLGKKAEFSAVMAARPLLQLRIRRF